ncbi:MAG TPA: chromosome segregation protein SMC [Steroidobacteraceae bacterium]|nr:chromosome segregation protein SMC [Steroidobacteraceae bacterium]
MRLTRIKLAGFKSFVDPTQINLPSNLTGVVGPNGCGKSNVIDAVRWVMGELSARHLRGDSMTDVVFNGSAARKPVGSASVELVFDNADGKIGGAYASYAEISLRRQVGRDGSSAYFINGTRCRRKDITNLFLGTGLGSRSYAIIEQGMITRVIDAKADDMRAFVEEAAGISRYKERRKETEVRIAETRENLERLQDVRDEVEKQIRHLQRQAASARRYQALKEQERRLAAEVLALRLRDLDSGAEVHDAALRERELAMQRELATQRAAEAAIEKQRGVHAAHSDGLSAVQARYYEVGADVSRLEQSIEHTRELRERQRADLAQAQATLGELGTHIERDEAELASVRAQLERLAPEREAAQESEGEAARQLEHCEQALQQWQQRWEAHAAALAAAERSAQVERARLEQLEGQLSRLDGQAARLALESADIGSQELSAQLAQLSHEESAVRTQCEAHGSALLAAQAGVQAARTAQLDAEQSLEHSRGEREVASSELTSLAALQAAALADHSGRAQEWLEESGLGGRPRLAALLEVEPGWERAVETALGDYLEAVCVARLDALSDSIASLAAGSITLVEGEAIEAAAERHTLASRVRGPAAVLGPLRQVLTAESLSAALRARSGLAPGESLITPEGEWVGRDWLRISRGADAHAGVLVREQRLKGLRVALASCAERVRQAEEALGAARAALQRAESEREAAQAQLQGSLERQAEISGVLEAARARAQAASLRGERLQQDAGEVARERAAAATAHALAASELARALEARRTLEDHTGALTQEREEHRAALQRARARLQAAQLAARDLHVQLEARRSTETSVAQALGRMLEQREQLARRGAELAAELASGDEPILRLQARLEATLTLRFTVEGELGVARAALEEAESALRSLDEQRLAAEQRVQAAREAMEQARLAAQETHVRRAALAEQFAQSGWELPAVQAQLAPEADVPGWEDKLSGTRGDIERLGSVNLAAIDELRDHSQRKEYLDSQFADLSSALDTLAEAMRRIDRETRTRFEDTFERINTGLREKFPRLFGGGHAYLELVGDDKLTAGVAVMARPPGKKNSTIHLLSGGEKALTAVALVFSIFDLNPAPFCLLDEVDAPLDEHNVGRFCDIVREMSSRVQFVFITHNKGTMELASQLIGVTMNEPGVSRLVTVDVDEAVRLAAV